MTVDSVMMTTPPDPTWQSIHSLAEFAMHASGADGYAFYELDNAGELSVRDFAGLLVGDPTNWHGTEGPIFRDGITVSSWSLCGEDDVSGLIVFAFIGHAIDRERTTVLDRLARVIEAVYRLPRSTARLATKINSLDAELAGIKISERTLGLLANGAPSSETVEIVIRHVERVLQGCLLGTALEQLLADLEERIAERRLVVQAKQVLQRRHGISEEQAYLQLRNQSRATRKRLRDVAQELIAS